ncbi:MAG: YggT family protein [Spirochaetales bacterium]
MLKSVMSLLSALVSFYSLIIIIRILLSWFASPLGYGKVYFWLIHVTDPYLNYFRRFGVFTFGKFDFSPVVALLTLSVLGNIFHSIGMFGRITLGSIVAFALGAVWSAVSFFLVLYLLLIVIRLLGILFHSNSTRPIWLTLDAILSPFLLWLSRIFTKKPIPYLQGLLLGLAFLLTIRLLGGILVQRLVALLFRFPI